jgi:hypothetical protein
VKRRRWTGLAARAATGIAVIAMLGGRAVAQCAMCGSATPYAGTSAGRTAAAFAAAALVLLVPVLGMLAALVGYVWRHRH